MILQRLKSPFLKRKIWITQQNLTQNQKYFNLLVSGPGRFELWKIEGKKSCWTNSLTLCPTAGTMSGMLQIPNTLSENLDPQYYVLLSVFFTYSATKYLLITFLWAFFFLTSLFQTRNESNQLALVDGFPCEKSSFLICTIVTPDTRQFFNVPTTTMC